MHHTSLMGEDSGEGEFQPDIEEREILVNFGIGPSQPRDYFIQV